MGAAGLLPQPRAQQQFHPSVCLSLCWGAAGSPPRPLSTRWASLVAFIPPANAAGVSKKMFAGRSLNEKQPPLENRDRQQPRAALWCSSSAWLFGEGARAFEDGGWLRPPVRAARPPWVLCRIPARFGANPLGFA